MTLLVVASFLTGIGLSAVSLNLLSEEFYLHEHLNFVPVAVAFTLLLNIVMLNALIAIMGDTFARVSEIKDQSALVEKIRILSDYVIVVRRESEERGDLSRFIYAISPKSLGQDEAGSWEGTVTQLKKAIDGSMS